MRDGLFELTRRYGLDAVQARRLHALAGLAGEPAEPAAFERGLRRGVAVLGAALIGLGLVMWVAANWSDFGRGGRFALLQGALVVAALAAAVRPAWRAPAALLALIVTGALFAYFGQTYQTGADAWQLFALWAVLTVPLGLAARSDIVWAPWSLVAMLAIALWVQTQTGHRWRIEPGDLPAHLSGLVAMLGVTAALSPAAARWTGAGPWGLRTASLFAVIALGIAALGGLFSEPVRAQYGLGLAILGMAAALLATPRGFDVFALSAVALALDALLIAGLGRWLFDDRHRGGEPIGEMLLLGLAAAALLALSVHAIMKLARRAEVQR